MNEDEKGKLAEGAASAGLALVTAATAGSTPEGIAAASVIAFAPYVVGQVIPMFLKRKEREVREWWDVVVMENAADRGARIEIERRAGEPAVQEVLVSGFKLILDAISPRVIPAVGLLTRRYARAGAARDWFFVGMATVLTEVGEAEYEDLRVLCRWCAEAGPAGARWATVHHNADSRGVDLPEYEHLAFEVGLLQDPLTTPPGFSLTHVRRLFSLLKRSGLANEAPAGGAGASSGPGVINFEVQTMRRVAEIVDGR